MEFTNSEGIKLVEQVILRIKENRDYLSCVDGEAGDGDHGINMSKGMTFAQEEITNKNHVTMSEGFMTISKILISKIGGSMGPLYGSFFHGLGIASKKEDIINKDVMSKMLNKAYSNLTGLTDAKPGDKTLIDVLSPAIEAYDASEGDFKTALEDMIAAGEAGLLSTKDMIAKIGRSSRLGERSRGHQDAGATSCYIILKAIADASIELLEN